MANLVVRDAVERGLDLGAQSVLRLPQPDGGPVGLAGATFDGVLKSDRLERACLARQAQRRAQGLRPVAAREEARNPYDLVTRRLDARRTLHRNPPPRKQVLP